MPILETLVKSFMSGLEPPLDHEIKQVSISSYVLSEVICRLENVVLYGPSSSNKYEIVLHPLLDSVSCSSAFSISRVQDKKEAQHQFDALANVLASFTHCSEYLKISYLSKICATLECYPNWNAEHVAAHLDYTNAFNSPRFKKNIDVRDRLHGKTPLHVAIEADNRRTVNVLLSLGANPSIVDDNGNTIFHMCASSSPTVIQMILNTTVESINDNNHDGKSALHVACEKNNPEYAKLLVASGVTFNTSDDSPSNETSNVKEIMNKHQKQVDDEDVVQGGTPLHWVTSREMISAFLELGCDINARNFKGETALHILARKGYLDCVIELLTNGASTDISDFAGNSPLHVATTYSVLQTLLVFGAHMDAVNEKDHSALHVISTADGSLAEKNEMLYCLHAIGAARCKEDMECGSGCSPNDSFIGVSPHPEFSARTRLDYDIYLDQICDGSAKRKSPQGARLLSLDGGGTKGLVLIQLIQALMSHYDGPITDLFDWICGTSTGGLIALALSMGKTAMDCRNIYFRFKNAVFFGEQPYNSETLEKFLKSEFGETTKMSDIKGVKVVIPAVKCDQFPAELYLFRNYESGQSLYKKFMPDDQSEDSEEPDYYIWEAARASSAAPTFFKSYKEFLDGGLIANNPTMDLITEVFEYSSVMKTMRKEYMDSVDMVLSLGVGRPPTKAVTCPNITRPLTQIFLEMSEWINLKNLLIDQATMSDNHTVDRARALCAMSGIDYVRFSPQLHKEVELNETENSVLVEICWETMRYCHERRDKMQDLVQRLLRNKQDTGYSSIFNWFSTQ